MITKPIVLILGAGASMDPYGNRGQSPISSAQVEQYVTVPIVPHCSAGDVAVDRLSSLLSRGHAACQLPAFTILLVDILVGRATVCRT
jgi:hypothetical protein